MNIRIPWKKTAILGVVSVVLLFFIVRNFSNVSDLTSIFSEINWFYFWLAFSTLVPTLILNAIRWQNILRGTGFHVPFKQVFIITTGTVSFSVIPGRLGDLARSYPLRETIPPTQSIGSILFEKIIDVAVLLCFSAVGLIFFGQYIIALLLCVVVCAIIPMLSLSHTISQKLSSNRPLLIKINEAFTVLREIRKRKKFLAIAIVASVLNWTFTMLQGYWLFLAVHAHVPWTAIISYLPLSIFVGLIPITLAGIGTRDAALIKFFGPIATASHALAVGLLYSFQGYGVLSLIGIPLLYVLRGRRFSATSQQ